MNCSVSGKKCRLAAFREQPGGAVHIFHIFHMVFVDEDSRYIECFFCHFCPYHGRFSCAILRVQRLKEKWGGNVFTIYSDSRSDSTIVPNLFIDEYMRDANDAQLKIYLYLIRMMGAGRGTSIADLADQFNHTEREVIRSLKYWEKQGLLCLDYDSSHREIVGIRLCDPKTPEKENGAEEAFAPVQTPAPEKAPAPVQAPAPAQEAAPTVPGKASVGAAELRSFREAGGGAELIFIVEKYLGKPLSVPELKTLYYLSEQLHFSNDLIDYVVQYCVDRGKKDFRYIEKVAVNWAENGITTPKQAEFAACAALRSGKTRVPRKTPNPFVTQISNHQYDFDQLEKELLSN